MLSNIIYEVKSEHTFSIFLDMLERSNIENTLRKIKKTKREIYVFAPIDDFMEYIFDNGSFSKQQIIQFPHLDELLLSHITLSLSDEIEMLSGLILKYNDDEIDGGIDILMPTTKFNMITIIPIDGFLISVELKNKLELFIPDDFENVGLDCFPNMYGFRNLKSSCFIDALLIAMFAHINSPFYPHLIDNDIVFSKETERLCSDDIDEDRAIRYRLQELLRLDIDEIINGERIYCTDLRNLLGDICRFDNRVEDLSVGEHDPSEIYERLLDSLNYNPVTYSERETRSTDDKGSKTISKINFTVKSNTLPPLNVGDKRLKVISWPKSWNSEYEYMYKGAEYMYRKLEYDIVEADLIGIHMGRKGYAQDERTKELYLKYDTRYIYVSQELLINNITYKLSSVIYMPEYSDHHWTTLINCKDVWYSYDDTDTNKPFIDIPMKDFDAIHLMNTRGSMFFYYPIIR